MRMMNNIYVKFAMKTGYIMVMTTVYCIVNSIIAWVECEVLKKNSVFFVQSLTTADLYVRHIALILGVSIYSFICILPSV